MFIIQAFMLKRVSANLRDRCQVFIQNLYEGFFVLERGLPFTNSHVIFFQCRYYSK